MRVVASANQAPRIDLQVGLAALEEDLPKVLKILGAASLETLGWKRPEKLLLLVPLSGTFQGHTDNYVLHLGFHAYREWPPSAQFVNPETGQYQYPQDQHYVPKLSSPGCQTHIAYPHPNGRRIQLICCSATLEFYEVLHSVNPEHVWTGNCTFLTTLRAIQHAMQQHYGGRFESGK